MLESDCKLVWIKGYNCFRLLYGIHPVPRSNAILRLGGINPIFFATETSETLGGNVVVIYSQVEGVEVDWIKSESYHTM